MPKDKKKIRCANCKCIIQGRPALSRKDNKSAVCQSCGLKEALNIYEAHNRERSNNNA